MYEKYTDKQIVEMLGPKLRKLGWGNVVNNDLYPDTVKMIATIYRSGYIRGQLGRSFIIGEKKEKADKTGRWVPVDGNNVKKGDSVRYIKEEMHENNPEYYPAKGVVGKVLKVCSDRTCNVQWPKGTTSSNDRWYAPWGNLEVLVEEPAKAEQWVPATKDNVKFGDKVKYISNDNANRRYGYFPPVGTIGKIITNDEECCYVRWAKGTTDNDGCWWTNYNRLEVLVCE